MTESHLPSGTSPEQISRRYHLIRVVVTVAVMGAITLMIGLAAFIDPENLHPFKYLAGCLVVAAICGVLLLILRRPNLSVTSVDIVILIGLSATFANTVYGGLLDVDPWWQVCVYLVVIMIAGGVSIRRLTTFCTFIAAGLVAWVIVISDQNLDRSFIFDTYVAMLLGAIVAGAIVAGAILLLFRTERRRVTSLNRELLANATHDALTGILNRIGLLQALASTPRDGSPAFQADWCAYFDVDFFKSINDRRGHDHGDDVLRAVAAALTDVSTEGSLTARWGGDEFVLIGSGEAPKEEELEKRVNSRISEIEPGGTVSVGISQSDADNPVRLADLLKQADIRMYERRNQVRATAASTVS